MVPGDSGTLVHHSTSGLSDTGTMVEHGTNSMGGTMIQHDTLVPDSKKLVKTQGDVTDLESNLGTMVINNDDEEDDDTMKRELTFWNTRVTLSGPSHR